LKQDTQKTQRIQHPDWIIKERENIIEFLKELIKTPSLSGQEKEIAELIQRKMVELGYTVHVDDMGNVIGIIGKGRHTVLFDSHMDHISPGTLNNWKFPPYSGKIIDKEMYGRGVVDMKGAVASLIYGCANSKDDVKKILACVVHEETNEGVATRKIIDEYNGKIDSCVLGEPTDLKLSIGQ
jgi:acetylornithine deacetylase/succinyl-diaminopimelate desuccinylase-like protein